MERTVPIDRIIRPLMFLKDAIELVADDTLRERFSLTFAQIKILMPIHFQGSSTQSELAQFWNVSEASIHRQVSILIQRGYVTRAKDKDDLRKQRITLTAKAKKIIPKCIRVLDAKMENIFREVPDAKRKHFEVLVRLFISTIEKAQPSFRIYDFI